MGIRFDTILEKKKNGLELTTEEIGFFVQGLMQNTVSSAQIGALCAFVTCRGMTASETVALTLAMADSGQRVQWDFASDIKIVDKHSTGGVGDKVSMILAPLWAKMGYKVPMVSANGAGYKSAPKLIRSLGAKLKVIGNKPNGFNINKNCGSTFPEKLRKNVRKFNADLGISLDGDADRIIMCDEKGSIIDGDQIIAALALQWKKKKILKGGVIGTLMSNYGLEKFLKKKGIKFLRANVGDRYVKELMQKKKFNLGGEQSGHIILGKFATTGDGLLVALEVIKAINKKTKASRFFNVFEKIPQILENIKIKDDKILNNKSVKMSIKIAKKIIKGNGRILVRKSGTEPMIRIMGESENKLLLKRCIKIISEKIKKN